MTEQHNERPQSLTGRALIAGLPCALQSVQVVPPEPSTAHGVQCSLCPAWLAPAGSLWLPQQMPAQHLYCHWWAQPVQNQQGTWSSEQQDSNSVARLHWASSYSSEHKHLIAAAYYCQREPRLSNGCEVRLSSSELSDGRLSSSELF